MSNSLQKIIPECREYRLGVVEQSPPHSCMSSVHPKAAITGKEDPRNPVLKGNPILSPPLSVCPSLPHYPESCWGTGERAREDLSPPPKLWSRLALVTVPQQLQRPWGISHISSVSAGPWAEDCTHTCVTK